MGGRERERVNVCMSRRENRWWRGEVSPEPHNGENTEGERERKRTVFNQCEKLRES